MSLFIPPQLKDLMYARGVTGKQWLEDLPTKLEKLSDAWQIELEEPFANCFCNYVTSAKTKAGQAVVLKVCYPDTEFDRELEYYRLHPNGAMPKLLEVDRSVPALLLEKVEPAQTLAVLNEDDAIKVTAELMQKLWRPAPPEHNFKYMESLYDDFVRLQKKFPHYFSPEIVEKTDRAYHFLTSTPQEQFVLHGDLHHFNIIADHQRGWVVIDPNAKISEKAYEVSSFLRNPPAVSKAPNLKQVLKQRILRFAELLHIDPQRIYLWGLFQTVLSTYWDLEDGSGVADEFGTVAKALAELKV